MTTRPSGKRTDLQHDIGSLPDTLEACLQLIDDDRAPDTLCIDVWRHLSQLILDHVTGTAAVDAAREEMADQAAFGTSRKDLRWPRRPPGNSLCLKQEHDF